MPSLLDEFRASKGARQWEVSDLAGSVVPFCMDQHGSRFMQQRIEAGAGRDRALIFAEVRPCARVRVRVGRGAALCEGEG